MSLASFTALSDVSNRLSKVSKKLATGLRINSASDDASGLAVSQKMRAQIRGLDRSAKNAQDGISLLQTAEGGIQEITSLLQRMRELSVQGANDVLTSEDRGHIQGEIDELSSQVDAIANQTQFNRKKLLNGDMSALWSTSTSHLSVVMPGSGRAGGTEEAAAVRRATSGFSSAPWTRGGKTYRKATSSPSGTGRRGPVRLWTPGWRPCPP
jgi:flagellin